MKRKKILTLLFLCYAVFFIVGCENKKEPNKNTTINSGEYSIVTNINSITEKTWNSSNTINKSISNKEYFDNQYNTNIGNRQGVLSIPNNKYETHIKYNGNYYKLTINPNEWFFMNEISSDLGNTEEIKLYVLDTKFVMNEIIISFEDSINEDFKNAELYNIQTYNNWKIITDKNRNSNKWAYYELNDKDYIIIGFSHLSLSNKAFENFYKEFFQNFYVESTPKENLRVEFNKDDLQFNLTDNISIDLSNVTIKNWFVDSTENENVVTLNYNNQTIQLSEKSNISIEEQINIYNDDVTYTITDSVDYNGLKIYLIKLGNHFTNAGNLVGGIFEINNRIYKVFITTGSMEINSTDSINNAINELLAPIFVIQ